MTDKRSQDRPSFEATKTWIEQRKQKTSATASFAPHTPPAQRSLSTFSSPGSILGKEEDAVIIELTPRYLLAGVEGESGPQCRLSFGPNSNRRIGDHRIWLPGYRRKRERLESWGRDYELWRCDLDDVDLGLLSDTLERAVHTAYNKQLLIDAGTGRLVLVLPSLVPHPVLETILSTLFQRWNFPSITLLPSPAMSLVAAGVRSGLVVDIGWEETTVTSIYEYRELGSHQTVRAVKLLSQRFAELLKQKLDSINHDQSLRFDLDVVEEVMTRTIASLGNDLEYNNATGLRKTSAVPDDDPGQLTAGGLDIEIDWPSGPASHSLKLSSQQVQATISRVHFGEDEEAHYDDNELPLHQTIFKLLQSLSPDVRGACMSRIVFTGDGSTSRRVRDEALTRLQKLIENNGWSSVKGKHVRNRLGLSEIAQARAAPADATFKITIPTEKDYVEEKLLKHRAKLAQTNMQGELRAVHSLGSWIGASLMTCLKVRGFVEIDRDRFLSHGLMGASRDLDNNSLTSQQKIGNFSVPMTNKAADRSSWTLGGWA